MHAIQKNIRMFGERITTATAQHWDIWVFEHPATLFGVHWEINARLESQTSGTGIVNWAIGVQRDGETSTLSMPILSGLTNVISPEVDMFATGQMMVLDRLQVHGGGDTTVQTIQAREKGAAKTQRKVKKGDILRIFLRSNAALGVRVTGIITFWYKL